LKGEGKRVAVFQPEFIEDLSYWVETERRTAKRLLDLVKATLRDPFKGIGHPEPLGFILHHSPGSTDRSARCLV
jgi:toxin YoeB